jgi:hypothetical protein
MDLLDLHDNKKQTIDRLIKFITCSEFFANYPKNFKNPGLARDLF